MSARGRRSRNPAGRHRLRLIALTTAFLCGPLIVGPGAAQATDLAATLTIDSVRWGIGGAYKLGKWTPVQVTVTTSDQPWAGRLVVQTTDPNGVAVDYVRDGLQIPASTTQTLTSYVQFGQAAGDVLVRLQATDGGRVMRRIGSGERPAPLPASEQLVLQLGGDLGIDPSRQLRLQATWIVATGERVQDLPRHWLGYSAVDAIVLTTSGPWQLNDDERSTALRRWVELGGRIVVCGAAQAELFGPSGPLEWLAPAVIEGVTQQRQTSGIEQFAEATTRLDQVDRRGARFSLPMAQVREPRGRVEASEGFGSTQSATVVRGAAGMGRVVFVAFDLDQPPFTTWPDQPRLIAKLMSFVLDESGSDESLESALGPVAHVGYSDLIGQLRHALDQFPNVRLVPFFWIAGLLAVYILVIGPIDYWLLQRWGRPEWTWVSFTLGVLAFTLASVVMATRWKGSDFHCNQASLVDVDLEQGWVRGTTWAHVYSPRTEKVELTTQPSDRIAWATRPAQATHWQGLPGDGFGGLDRRDPTETFTGPYQVVLSINRSDADDVRVENFPIAVWSSQSVRGQWWGRAELPVDNHLSAGSDGMLSGHMKNPLPVELVEAYLIYDRWTYHLGSVPPGGVVQVDRTAPLDLQSHLTQRTVAEGRNVTTPWNQSSADVPRILQLLSFYNAAKGRGYTRLAHRFERGIDWSDHLTAGRAVLWGRGAQPAAELRLNGQSVTRTQDWTYYRLLIPVASR